MMRRIIVILLVIWIAIIVNAAIIFVWTHFRIANVVSGGR